jgi:hypothetical protein
MIGLRIHSQAEIGFCVQMTTSLTTARWYMFSAGDSVQNVSHTNAALKVPFDRVEEDLNA